MMSLIGTPQTVAKIQNERALGRSNGCDRRLGFVPIRQFGNFLVIVALESPKLPDKLMPPRNKQTFSARIEIGRSDGVVVCFRVKCSKRWWLVSGDSCHLPLPASHLIVAWFAFFLNLCKQMIIIALQGLVIARLATEVKNKLCRTDARHCRTYKALRDVITELPRQITHCTCADENDDEVKPAIPTIKREPSRCMVECVSKNIEPYQVATHRSSHFFGGVGADGRAGDEGCRGPGPTEGLGGTTFVIVGCLTPKLFCSKDGCLVPMLFIEVFVSLLTERVSKCFAHGAMLDFGSHCNLIRSLCFSPQDCIHCIITVNRVAAKVHNRYGFKL